ncbi:MAG: HNH endonuclease [Hamadaea sp.]|nr:HNH endonuclease [Hamadaea sp.]
MARRRERAARKVKASTRRRDTGPTADTRILVVLRAHGCCEYCGRLLLRADGTWTGDHSIHHRQPRGMGGSSLSAANSPANLLLLCGSGTTGCHGYLERYRTQAEQDGWIVRHGLDPADVPVAVFQGGAGSGVAQVLLTVDGDYAEVAA